METGERMYELAERLFPICRSITGDGVRETLNILKTYIPLEVYEVPTHTQVFDWTVPKEWNIREAWIKDPSGAKVVDFSDHTLHILNYSVPIAGRMSYEELRPHLYSLPDQEKLIPYRTSYYQENWGFCLAHSDLLALPQEGEYEVLIDSELKEGSLTYGELYIPGATEEEILFSAHVCHPSLANDNLSGISLLTMLAESCSKQSNHYSYRFLFIPGTIGAITWLAQNKEKTDAIRHGLVASLLGDPGNFTYKRSRQGNAKIDQVVEYVLSSQNLEHTVLDFIPYGYDERQFCSPGFNLPVGNLTRSQFGTYPEYHTSGDNLELIKPEYLETSYQLYKQIVEVLEADQVYQNVMPYCEPQLGKRGLYDAIGGESDRKELQMAILWLLNLSDGTHSLLDIAKRSGISFSVLERMTNTLVDKKLLKKYQNGNI